jgi:hypothetical protein
MCPVIDNPARCEFCAIIHFLHAKNISAAEILNKLCTAVYSQNVMTEATIRKWCRMFSEWTNAHDEEWSGRPSVVSDDFVQSVDQKICERWRFAISGLLCEFPQISCIVLYEIIIVAQYVFWNVHGHAQNEENGFDFFYSDTTKMAMNFSITSYEWQWWNLGFICECWKQMSSQSSGCTLIHQTSQSSLNKRLPARKLTVTVFWD